MRVLDGSVPLPGPANRLGLENLENARNEVAADNPEYADMEMEADELIMSEAEAIAPGMEFGTVDAAIDFLIEWALSAAVSL